MNSLNLFSGSSLLTDFLDLTLWFYSVNMVLPGSRSLLEQARRGRSGTFQCLSQETALVAFVYTHGTSHMTLTNCKQE